MKKSLFAVGVLAMVLMIASCDNTVSVEVERPGAPRNVTLRVVNFIQFYGATAQRWAVVEWEAAANAESFQVFRRVGSQQPQGFGDAYLHRGRWIVQEEGSGSLVYRWWEERSGTNTQQWTTKFRIDTESLTMWQGEVQIGVMAFGLGGASCAGAPSGIAWVGDRVTFTNQPGATSRSDD